jgi:hypothetical protein
VFPEGWVRPVRDQPPVVVRPRTWTKYDSMADLGELPDTIARTELAEEACRPGVFDDDLGLRRLFVLTMMWGSGTRNGRGPRNTSAALSTPGALDILRDAHRRVLEADLGGAYGLHKRITGLGPAFLTKWLWVAGVATDIRPQPLIQDRRVWFGLGKLGWNSRTAAGGSRLWGDRYVAYLGACEIWAAQGGVTPEDIEYSLFVEGGRS